MVRLRAHILLLLDAGVVCIISGAGLAVVGGCAVIIAASRNVPAR